MTTAPRPLQMRRVPEGPRPPPRDGPALSNDNLPDLMPSLKDYLNAKPVEYRKRGWAERISDGLHTLFWVAASMAVVYVGDGKRTLIDVLRWDQQINRTLLHASIGLGLLFFCLFVYVSVYLQWYLGIAEDYYSAAPWSIPTATGLGMGSMLLFTAAIWPKFEFWSLIVTPLLFMGFVFTLVLHDMLMGIVFLPIQGLAAVGSRATNGGPGKPARPEQQKRDRATAKRAED